MEGGGGERVRRETYGTGFYYAVSILARSRCLRLQ